MVFALCLAAGGIAGLARRLGRGQRRVRHLHLPMVTAAVLALSETVTGTARHQEELARSAVEKERLRFSRDLHDLLGHTLSVIVVKSEAARRLAPRDLDAAIVQITDIESVGRQALTEIREAVTGYREGSLATELDRARSSSPRPASSRSYGSRDRRWTRRPRRCWAGWSARPSPTPYATRGVALRDRGHRDPRPGPPGDHG